MNFSDAPEEAAFRAEAREWLQRHASPRDLESLVVNQETGDFTEQFPAARAWQAMKFDAGFGAIAFPREFGGRGGTSLQNMIEEDLVAERVAIDSYREMIQYVGDADSTTRRMLEEILAVEEKHADDMATLLKELPALRQ